MAHHQMGLDLLRGIQGDSNHNEQRGPAEGESWGDIPWTLVGGLGLSAATSARVVSAGGRAAPERTSTRTTSGSAISATTTAFVSRPRTGTRTSVPSGALMGLIVPAPRPGQREPPQPDPPFMIGSARELEPSSDGTHGPAPPRLRTRYSSRAEKCSTPQRRPLDSAIFRSRSALKYE